MFKFLAKAHDVTISHNYAKVSNARMIARAGRIKAACRGKLPRAKRNQLKAELAHILTLLGARKEACETIVNNLLEE